MIGMLLCFALCLSLTSFSVSAVAEPQNEARAGEKKEPWLVGVSNKNPSAYTAVSVTHNGVSLGNIGRIIGGVVYVPIRQYVETTTDLTVTYYSSTRTVTVSGGGHNISASHGAYTMYANGRALFATSPSVLMSNGRMYVPFESLARALSLGYEYSSDTVRTKGTAAPLTPAEQYYREDAVYWLSRIISAESRGESLLGQIAVGNVILNRVASGNFPNTIWGVIFDRKYGVQFSPVANGTVYNAPTYNATLAAKICLEGFTLSDETMYFVAPKVVSDSWIQRTREYAFSIGNHDFYK